MHIFISWSKDPSHAAALLLKEWLPKVIQTAKPWVSSSDLEKGSSWFDQISKNLTETTAGLVIVTPQNQSEPWINYEAGGIATLLKDRAMPIAFRMKKTDISGPLGGITGTELENKDDMRQLLAGLRPDTISEDAISYAFEREWGDLATSLSQIPEPDEKAVPGRTTDDKVDEVLEIVRSLRRPVAPQQRATPMPQTAGPQGPGPRGPVMRLSRLVGDQYGGLVDMAGYGSDGWRFVVNGDVNPTEVAQLVMSSSPGPLRRMVFLVVSRHGSGVLVDARTGSWEPIPEGDPRLSAEAS